MNDNGCSQWHDVTDDMDSFCHKYLDGNKTSGRSSPVVFRNCTEWRVMMRRLRPHINIFH